MLVLLHGGRSTGVAPRKPLHEGVADKKQYTDVRLILILVLMWHSFQRQYESIPCSDTSGDHHHNGIAGGYSYGMKAARDFNRDLKALGVFQTGADAYFWSGANRWNHADTGGCGAVREYGTCTTLLCNFLGFVFASRKLHHVVADESMPYIDAFG